MTPHNLAVVFGPTILHAREETMANACNSEFVNFTCESFITHYQDIFQVLFFALLLINSQETETTVAAWESQVSFRK